MSNVAIETQGTLRRKIIEMLALSSAFGICFLIINYMHFQTLTVSVILFACIWDAILASLIVSGGFYLFWRKKSALLSTEFALVAIASNLLILLYSVMGPTVIDRSLSLYIVNKIDQRGGEVSEAAMGDVFVQEYLPEFRLVDVRLTEQVTSGTVRIEDGCIYLTPKGKTLSGFVGWYRTNFLPQKRNLMGEVTDQLTNPFKNAEAVVDTACSKR